MTWPPAPEHHPARGGDVDGAELGTEDYAFYLRATRAGPDDAHQYHIINTATDTSGRTARSVTIVTVSH
ncbi:MAG TPA: hypothetical protein VFW45_16765, partial [Candidatus Polarisedimenticolia bacterium]|nr:hypothetical protein [Candidatus Polarisedimenticolia bacterium]